MRGLGFRDIRVTQGVTRDMHGSRLRVLLAYG